MAGDLDDLGVSIISRMPAILGVCSDLFASGAADLGVVVAAGEDEALSLRDLAGIGDSLLLLRERSSRRLCLRFVPPDRCTSGDTNISPGPTGVGGRSE